MADVRLLGPIEVIGPNGPAQLVGARQRGLLALLALNAGTIVPQSRLVDALWDNPPRTAERSLHSHVSRVRTALESCGLRDALITRDPGYLLALPRETVDALRFEDAARNGSVQRLRAALALWRGDALADGEPAGWAAAEVDRLHELRLAAFEDLWEAELAAGRHAAAISELERELVGAPIRERLVGLLMLALYRCGRHADALDRYARLRARLADELGADPGPSLQRLHTAILRRDPALDLAPQPAPAAEHSLPAPAQLPPPAGHFCGRDDELAALDRPPAQIVVVSGPGGIGKTTLAVHWAHRSRARYPDGQLFLDLRGDEPDAALTPGEALTHALRSLGVPADRVPADLAEQTALYRSLVGERRLLVLLDNAGTADHVLPLVPTAGLLLVTSRHQLAALAVHHEVHAVPLDVLPPGEALTLLGRVIGADRVRREPADAARLVELCGRMPLALRIAAAKLAARPRQDIADLVADLSEDRLDALRVEGDARSVRNVFASAYDALSEPAARLFRLLGLHPGVTVTTHLAAAVTGLSHGRARRSVDELAAAHLITEVASGRYRFHDLVRLYARECAQAEEHAEQRAEAVRRILGWYLDLAHAANRTLDPARDRVPRPDAGAAPFPPEHAATLAFLDGEHGNLTAVVEHAARTGHDEAAWQLTYLLAGYFESRGHWADRVAMGCWGLGAARQLGDPAVEGLMRSGLGVACIAARRFDDALEHLHHALALMRACGDRRGEGHAYNNLAAAYAELRRFDEAVDAFGQALAVHTASGHRAGTTLALNNLGYLYGVLGKTEDGLAHLERGLALAREDANTRMVAAILHSLGQVHRLAGNHAAALDHFEQALRARRQTDDRLRQARTLGEIGLIHLLDSDLDSDPDGDLDAALATFREAAALAREIGDEHLETIVAANIGRAHLQAGDLAAAREVLERALAMRVRIPDGYEEANLHRWLGDLAERGGDATAAAGHWQRAVELYRKVNATTEASQLADRSPR